jgi:hypothetical protein
VKSILGFLANLLLFLSISTLLFSVAAYFAFKLKGKRKPKVRGAQVPKAGASTSVEPELLQQYVQPESVQVKPAQVKPDAGIKQERTKSRSS